MAESSKEYSYIPSNNSHNQYVWNASKKNLFLDFLGVTHSSNSLASFSHLVSGVKRQSLGFDPASTGGGQTEDRPVPA